MIINAALVGAGGFAGSVVRYGLSLLSQHLQFSWPFGTLSSNVLGCLVIGMVAALSDRSGALSPEIRLALATGFCGGFTTMSSMIYETAAMLRVQEFGGAALYACGTMVLSMGAFFAGGVLVHLFFKIGGGAWN
jgi:CrcB protein